MGRRSSRGIGACRDGDTHTIVDTVTDDPERRCPPPPPHRVRRDTIGAFGRRAGGHARVDERVANELRPAATERPEPLARPRDPHGRLGADPIGVDDRAAPAVGPRDRRRLLDPRLDRRPRRIGPGPGSASGAGASDDDRSPDSVRGAGAHRPARPGARRAARRRAARRGRPRAPRRPSTRPAAADRASCARRGGRARRGNAASAPASSGACSAGQRVEQLVVVAEERGLAGEHLDEIALRAALEARHHLAAQPDAPVVELVVHRIAHRRPLQSARRSPACRRGAARAAAGALDRGPRACPRARRCRSPAATPSSTVSAWSSRVCPTRIATACSSSAARSSAA